MKCFNLSEGYDAAWDMHFSVNENKLICTRKLGAQQLLPVDLRNRSNRRRQEQDENESKLIPDN